MKMFVFKSTCILKIPYMLHLNTIKQIEIRKGGVYKYDPFKVKRGRIYV